MDRLAGLVAFSLGLALFVFARAVARGAGDRLDRPAGHRATVAVRAAGLAAAALGFALVVR